MSRAVLVDRRVQPIRNRSANPKLSVNSGAWGAAGTAARVPVTDLYGISWEYERTGTGANSGARVYHRFDNLTVGARYSIAVSARRLGQPASLNVSEDSNVAGMQTLVAAAVGTGRERLGGSFTATTPTMLVQLRQVGSTTGSSTQAMTAVTIVEGDAIPWCYVDGDTPGWRWLGSPGLSESAGLPYTLERMLPGLAFEVNSLPGSVVVQSTADDTQGRSLFAVVDFLTAAVAGSGMVPVAAIGGTTSATSNTPAAAVVLRNPAAGSVQMTARYSSGGIAASVNRSNARTIGRHILYGQFETATTRGALTIDGQDALTIGGLTAAGGMPARNLTLAPADADNAPIASYGFSRILTSAERLTAFRWLATRYGAQLT